MPLKKFKISRCVFLFSVLLSAFFFLLSNHTRASAIDVLKKKIEDKNAQIKQVQQEIEKYQKEIESTAKEATILKNKIKNLEATKNKFIADIKLTENQIQSAQMRIEQLGLQIDFKKVEILAKKASLAEFLKNLNEEESSTMMEIMLAENSLADFFSDIEKQDNFQKKINSDLADIRAAKFVIENSKKEKEYYKKDMEVLKNKYTDQKEMVEMNRNKTKQLLNETKNKESSYKNLLAYQRAKQKAFEDEIRELEDRIQLEIDPDALPKAGSGVLRWPLDAIKITQYFGNTAFAKSNAAAYNNGGHNGVDFKAPVGTPVKAAREGLVIGASDTDKSCRGVSYGKWVVIKHTNNLSTLYAHLSYIKVVVGQNVDNGQIIGYSGDSGYVTGPHLHFGALASEGVEIKIYKSKICGTDMLIPIKRKNNAYLDPLKYL